MSRLPRLDQVTRPAARSDDPEAFDLGFWLLRATEFSKLSNSLVRGLFQRAVAGVDIERDLNSLYQSSTGDGAAGLWWEEQMYTLLNREYDVIETMEASRQWLSNLIEFEAIFVSESEAISVNLGSLWKHTELPEVRSRIEARYEILRLRVARINPAYFSAARSLGILFETFLEEQPPHRYLDALTSFLRDFQNAQSMERAIRNRLSSR
jgi:hypothetical protein